MWKLIVNLIVLFIPFSKNQARIRYKLKSLPLEFKARKKAKFIGKNLKIGTGGLIVNKKTIIKDDCMFNGLKIIGNNDVEIGNNVITGEECAIISESHNYHGDKIPYDETYINKPVIIKDFAWIGYRVTILPGTTIGEGAIIQAGSVVSGNIDDFAIAGGNPAKVFKYRDKEKFLKLKEEGKIFNS